MKSLLYIMGGGFAIHKIIGVLFIFLFSNLMSVLTPLRVIVTPLVVGRSLDPWTSMSMPRRLPRVAMGAWRDPEGEGKKTL